MMDSFFHSMCKPFARFCASCIIKLKKDWGHVNKTGLVLVSQAADTWFGHFVAAKQCTHVAEDNRKGGTMIVFLGIPARAILLNLLWKLGWENQSAMRALCAQYRSYISSVWCPCGLSRTFCSLYSLPTHQSFSFSRFPNKASDLAVQWCHKMQYFFDAWKRQDNILSSAFQKRRLIITTRLNNGSPSKPASL